MQKKKYTTTHSGDCEPFDRVIRMFVKKNKETQSQQPKNQANDFTAQPSTVSQETLLEIDNGASLDDGFKETMERIEREVREESWAEALKNKEKAASRLPLTGS